jgi:neurotransmitter:Na+ symporter, NSS family
MAGSNGGSAFVLIYVLCVLLVGIPIMMAEMLIGSRGRMNPVDSMYVLAKEVQANRRWQWVGWWGALGLLLVLSFYSVVAGWSIAYLFKALNGQLAGHSLLQIQTLWHSFLSSPGWLLFWHGLFMLLTVFVVNYGVQRGLERASNIMMPLLFFVLAALAIYGMQMPGVDQAMNFLFAFDFTKLTPSVIISALGHAFFTLAIGAGCILVYGSYLPPRTPIASSVVVIALLDVLVAILAGLAIFPVVFTYGLAPTDGPGLMFETLPIAFSQMSYGNWIGALFFLLLLFAAWTSSISLAEPLVIMLVERLQFSRQHACFSVGMSAWALGIGSVLSFNYWQDYKLLGEWNFFGAITDATTNIILPLGGLAFAIFAGWCLPARITRDELVLRDGFWFKLWVFLIRYVAPLGIITIILKSWFGYWFGW